MAPHPVGERSSPPPLTADEQAAWRAFTESGQLMQALLDRRLKESINISHADYGVLRRLQDADGGRASMLTLRHEVWFSRSRLTHQVKRLVAGGLVVKTDDVTDGRRQVLSLTPLGFDVVGRAQIIVRGVLREHFFGQLPAGGEADLLQTISSMVEHLREQPECQLFRNS